MDSIARTALLTAADRARERRRPDRLLDDALAHVLAGQEGAALLDAAPGEATTSRVMAIRTRFFDDWLGDVVGQGVRQVVLVAAGMDTRAFRLTWPHGTRLWELDRPELLAAKRELLEGAGARPVCERAEVAVDLGSDPWPEQVRQAGYRADLPSGVAGRGTSGVPGSCRPIVPREVPGILRSIPVTADR